MNRYPIAHNVIEAVRGDIAEQETEAIVNAANNLLWMGAGVAGAIKRKGGSVIEEAAIAQGPVEIGAAVVTSGGKLKAKYVIHAAVMGQDLHTDASKIQTATRNALALAEQKQIASLSFPALGTGVGGFSIFHCAKIMITEAIEHLMMSKNVHLVRFVLYDESSCKAFEDELKMQFSSTRHKND